MTDWKARAETAERQLGEARKAAVEAESHRAYYAKVMFRLKDTLLNVTDDMVEEGDRTYFGSTNDADALHAIALKVDDLHMEELLAHTQPKVNLYDAIESRMAEREEALNQASAAQSQLEEAREALRPLEQACKFGAARFRHYADLHAAKGTPDGDAKAQANAGCAETLEAALVLSSQALAPLRGGGGEECLPELPCGDAGPVARTASEAEPSTAWRPIDSAPRDQPVLVFAPGTSDRWEGDLGDLICRCEWHPDAGFCVCELREPTHWMPLPDAPPPGDRKAVVPSDAPVFPPIRDEHEHPTPTKGEEQ